MGHRFSLMIALVLALCAACGCEGAESSNLVAFQGSPCKSEPEELHLASFLYTPYAAEDYPGLTCIAWQVQGQDAIALDLVNFDGACGAEWKGEVVSSGPDQLRLEVVNPGCLVAGCGTCVYDWSFETNGLDLSGDLSLGVAVNTCPRESDKEEYAVTLPTASRGQGIVCRYTQYGALEWHAGKLGICGARHMPCADGPDGICAEAEAPCRDDLVCAARGEDPEETACLAPCSTDTDCDAPEVLGCDGGLCRLRESW